MSNIHKNLFSPLVFSILVLSSCWLNSTIPQQDQLNKKAELLYSAEQDKDRHAWSMLVVPVLRGKNKGDVNSAGGAFFSSRDFKLLDYDIASIRSVDPPSYITGATSAVALEMDVTIERKGVKEKVIDQTDYWAFIDGEWYWFWRGWPND